MMDFKDLLNKAKKVSSELPKEKVKELREIQQKYDQYAMATSIMVLSLLESADRASDKINILRAMTLSNIAYGEEMKGKNGKS